LTLTEQSTCSELAAADCLYLLVQQARNDGEDDDDGL